MDKMTKVLVTAALIGLGGAAVAGQAPMVQSGQTFADVMTEMCGEDGKIAKRTGVDLDGDGGFWTCSTPDPAAADPDTIGTS